MHLPQLVFLFDTGITVEIAGCTDEAFIAMLKVELKSDIGILDETHGVCQVPITIRTDGQAFVEK